MNEVQDVLQLLAKVAAPVAILLVVLVYLWREYLRTRRYVEELQRELVRRQFEEVSRVLDTILRDLQILQQELREHRRASE